MPPTASPDVVSATEVAAVTGVSLRDVHRVIDEQILPPEFLPPGDRRKVLTDGLPLITFYFGAADRLTAKERTCAIAHFGTWLISAAVRPAGAKYAFQDEFLTIDFAPFVVRAQAGLDRLAASRRLVVNSPDILGGSPVVRGTRVPVYDVASSVERGIDPNRILAAYPSLTSDDVALCALYAKANPLRGRPRQGSAASELTVVRKVTRPRRSNREAPH